MGGVGLGSLEIPLQNSPNFQTFFGEGSTHLCFGKLLFFTFYLSLEAWGTLQSDPQISQIPHWSKYKGKKQQHLCPLQHCDPGGHLLPSLFSHPLKSQRQGFSVYLVLTHSCIRPSQNINIRTYICQGSVIKHSFCWQTLLCSSPFLIHLTVQGCI